VSEPRVVMAMVHRLRLRRGSPADSRFYLVRALVAWLSRTHDGKPDPQFRL